VLLLLLPLYLSLPAEIAVAELFCLAFSASCWFCVFHVSTHPHVLHVEVAADAKHGERTESRVPHGATLSPCWAVVQGWTPARFSGNVYSSALMTTAYATARAKWRCVCSTRTASGVSRGRWQAWW
jgi:hypothetical protein